MTDGDAVPFDSLPEPQGIVITFQYADERTEYGQPTAATHVLHMRADGSHCYHSKDFKLWG